MIRTARHGDKGETGTRPLPDPSSIPLREPQPLSGDESDDDLLARCQAGDDAAWARLVQRYENLVFSTALRSGLNRPDAADVFQQVWFEVHLSLLRIRDPRSLTKWLIVTTRRIAYRHAIRSRRWVRDVLEDIVDPSPHVQAAMEGLEARQQLEAGLSRLDARCARLLRAFYFSGRDLAYEEVATQLGLKRNSVGPTRSRCLDRLRRIMEEAS
jgi:RNA polymerase sigma factor (sigma-70 family)